MLFCDISPNALFQDLENKVRELISMDDACCRSTRSLVRPLLPGLVECALIRVKKCDGSKDGVGGSFTGGMSALMSTVGRTPRFPDTLTVNR